MFSVRQEQTCSSTFRCNSELRYIMPLVFISIGLIYLCPFFLVTHFLYLYLYLSHKPCNFTHFVPVPVPFPRNLVTLHILYLNLSHKSCNFTHLLPFRRPVKCHVQLRYVALIVQLRDGCIEMVLGDRSVIFLYFLPSDAYTSNACVCVCVCVCF